MDRNDSTLHSQHVRRATTFSSSTWTIVDRTSLRHNHHSNQSPHTSTPVNHSRQHSLLHQHIDFTTLCFRLHFSCNEFDPVYREAISSVLCLINHSDDCIESGCRARFHIRSTNSTVSQYTTNVVSSKAFPEQLILAWWKACPPDSISSTYVKLQDWAGPELVPLLSWSSSLIFDPSIKLAVLYILLLMHSHLYLTNNAGESHYPPRVSKHLDYMT